MKHFWLAYKISLLALILLIQVSCLITTDALVEKELQNRTLFYSALLKKYQSDTRLALVVDDQDVYLRAKMDFSKDEIVTAAEMSHFFSSCDYFPYKEILIEALSNVGEASDINIAPAELSLSLVFNILYFKHGNRTLAKEYLEQYFSDIKLNLEKGYVRYDVAPDVKEYLNVLPLYSGAKTILKFTEEDLKFTKSLGIDISMYENLVKIYNGILSYVANLTDPLVRNGLQSFILFKEEFLSLISLVQTKKFLLPSKSYPLAFTDRANGYEQYFSFPYALIEVPQQCLLIGPLADLVKYTPTKDIDNMREYEMEMLNINTDLLGIRRKLPIPKDSFVESLVKIDNSEMVFLLTGTVSYNRETEDAITVTYNFTRKNFSYEQKELCKSFGCMGFKIEQLFTSNVENVEFPVGIKGNEINQDLMRMMKLMLIKKPSSTLLPVFAAGYGLSYNVEAKARIDYFTFIKRIFEANPTYEELLYEQFKMKSLEKSLTKFHELNEKILHSMPRKSELSDKINLFTIALNKKKVLNHQMMLALSEEEGTIIKDVARMRSKLVIS